jgi:transcriptional regulator NrdR family protein
MSNQTPGPALPGAQVGLRCRRCGHGRFRVLYTRPRPGGKLVRRRECRHCGERFTTWERRLGA